MLSRKNGRSWKVGEVSDLDGSLNSWMLKAVLFTNFLRNEWLTQILYKIVIFMVRELITKLK